MNFDVLIFYLSLLYYLQRYVNFLSEFVKLLGKGFPSPRVGKCCCIIKMTFILIWHSQKVRFALQGNIWQSLETVLVIITKKKGTAHIYSAQARETGQLPVIYGTTLYNKEH